VLKEAELEFGEGTLPADRDQRCDVLPLESEVREGWNVSEARRLRHRKTRTDAEEVVAQQALDMMR